MWLYYLKDLTLFILLHPILMLSILMYIKQFIKVFFWAHYFCCGSLTVQYLKKYCMIFQTKPEIYGNRYLLTVNKIVVVFTCLNECCNKYLIYFNALTAINVCLLFLARQDFQGINLK